MPWPLRHSGSGLRDCGLWEKQVPSYPRIPHLAPAQDTLRRHEWVGGCLGERVFAPEHAQPQACLNEADSKRIPEPEELEVRGAEQ